LPTAQWNRHWSLFPKDTDHLTHSYTPKKYYYNTPTDSSFWDHDVNCIFSQTVLKWSMGGMGGVIGGFSQRQKACLLHSLNTMASSTVQYNSHLLISATPVKFTTTHGIHPLKSQWLGWFHGKPNTRMLCYNRAFVKFYSQETHTICIRKLKAH
jgi:hypothetical protein